MKEQEMIIQELNRLVQVCRDGFDGFRKAALEVENEDYQALFRTTAGQRANFVVRLQDEVRKRGSRPPARGSLTGMLHRAWMNFRHQINPHQDRIVLMECRRGEEHALKAYEDVFENKRLADLQPVLESQFVSMIEMRNLLRESTIGRNDKDNLPSLFHLET